MWLFIYKVKFKMRNNYYVAFTLVYLLQSTYSSTCFLESKTTSGKNIGTAFSNIGQLLSLGFDEYKLQSIIHCSDEFGNLVGI